MSTCSKKSSRIICICCYTFYAAGMNIKKVKWKKVHIASWTQKSPGRGRFSEKNRSGAPGSLYGFAFASSNGVISLPAGFCFASRGGFPVVRGIGRPAGSRYLRWGGVLPEVVTSVRGTGRPAGSCYLRLGGVLPEVVTSVGGRPAGSRYLRSGDWASCRKLLPPFGGRPAGRGSSARRGRFPSGVISSSARCP